MTVNRIPMPKNRESAQDGHGMIGSNNAEVKPQCVIDTQESKSDKNSTQESKSHKNSDCVALPGLPGSILHTNNDKKVDISDGAMEEEIVGEDIFEEFYESRKELELLRKPGRKSAENLILPNRKELAKDMEAIIPEPTSFWDSGGDQVSTVFPAVTTIIESSIGNLAMETMLKDSNREVHAASSPAHDGISGGISSCIERIDAGTNCLKINADNALWTFFRMGLAWCFVVRGVWMCA